jgi:class 3 adenylate cyclase/CheY-like chemotaxis protein
MALEPIQATTQSSNGKPRILLVDDEPDTLQLIQKILQADGFEIFQATNGFEALEHVKQRNPDLILLDVVMPQMDGLAVLKEIRKQDQITGVIMVSALSSEQLAVQAMLEGADDFVGKPFTLKNIRVRIRQALEKSRLRRDNVTLQHELQIAHDKIRDLFSRYMAVPVVQRLLASPTLPSLGGERQITTVLFMDFCDFSSLSSNLEPDQVLRILNEHLALVTSAILEEEGTMDKFMGDGVMALFNTPVSQSDHALRAARSAVAIRDRVIDWGKTHEPSLRVRIGIHTGETVVGNIGTPEFMTYTAIGDPVNIAKRLQEESDYNSILVSDTTASLLHDSVDLTNLGERVVKGRQLPGPLYRLNAIRPSRG